MATLPKHVNINTLEMMPVSQSFAGLSVHRQANQSATRPAGRVWAAEPQKTREIVRIIP
ncbi:hypothetical protein LNP17_14890 [Klebsiella variicola subsp. variicola]|nr:hypothetical protein [Klebsiella variicola subsp. variicola]